MKEAFKGAAVGVPSVLKRLDGLHRLFEEKKRGLHHAAPALLREHLRLLRDKDKVFNDFLPGLGEEITTQNALRQVLEGLRYRRLAAVLQPGHSVYQISHRCANGTIPQFAAHGATAYHCGADLFGVVASAIHVVPINVAVGQRIVANVTLEI